MTHLESIRLHGDILEVEIFADDSFAGMFHTYAQLWDQQLRHRRTPGSVDIAGDWEVFSQHHYAAIVRAWGAWQAKSGIAECVGSWGNTAGDRLHLHAGVLSFYIHCTAMLENLNKCGLALKNDILHNDFANNDWFSKWEELRLERNLDAHDGVRPISDFEGAPAVDTSLLNEQHKTWARGSGDPRLLDEWVDDIWEIAHSSAVSAWSVLLGSCPTTAVATDSSLDLSPPPGSASGQFS